MSQLINSVVFAEDDETAEKLRIELGKVAKGMNVLAGYSNVKELHKGLKDEGDAIIFVDIKQGCENPVDYIVSLKLRKRKVVCITPANGDFVKVFEELKIPFLQKPLTSLKIEIILKEFATGNGKAAILLIAEKVIDAEKKKIKTTIINRGKSHVFKTKKGKRHIYLDSIFGFKVNKKTHHFYLIPVQGDDIRIMEGCEEIKEKLMEDGFECSYNGELLNLLHVDDVKRKGRYLYAETAKKDYQIGETHEKKFDEAYTKYWDERGR